MREQAVTASVAMTTRAMPKGEQQVPESEVRRRWVMGIEVVEEGEARKREELL